MSGMRPTGQLHLGHWLGVVVNYLRLQEEYDCFFSVADWHVLTTKYQDTDRLQQDTVEMVVDWLAAGVDPCKATIYTQSAVLENAELFVLLSMITPVNWLQRNPTLKEQVSELHLAEDNITYGLLGYPVLQTADILLMGGELVPVGKDQLPHLELSRDLARRFNHLFGELFSEPQPLLTEAPMVLGTDNRKMSKSYGNDIKLADSPEEVQRKVMMMITDPARIHKTDPGHPEICNVYSWYELLLPRLKGQVYAECTGARIGCVADKKRLAEGLNELLEPIRERRSALMADPGYVQDIVAEGNRKARTVAEETMSRVRDAMKLNVGASTLAARLG